jgi:ribbon-helix-helix CopG family protein
MTHMTKTQVYLREEELEALRQVAQRSGQSIAELVREAVRKVWLRPTGNGPVGLWDGDLRRTSVEHDSIYDEP